jgi:transposase
VAPGNDANAGKQRSRKTPQGNRALWAGMTPLAHAAARRGQKRAILAGAHAIVVSAFPMLSRNEPYRELGAHYVDEHRRHQLVDQLA